MIKANRFWIVWAPARGTPTRKHHSIEAAEEEARRLAKLRPGTEYYVLRARRGFVADHPKLTCIPLRSPPPDPDGEIPF